jgi:hypothetical protein
MICRGEFPIRRPRLALTKPNSSVGERPPNNPLQRIATRQSKLSKVFRQRKRVATAER